MHHAAAIAAAALSYAALASAQSRTYSDDTCGGAAADALQKRLDHAVEYHESLNQRDDSVTCHRDNGDEQVCVLVHAVVASYESKTRNLLTAQRL